MAHRLLMVGAGGVSHAWQRVLSAPGGPEVELTGLVEVDQATLAERGGELGVPEDARFQSLDEALAEVKPDVVLCLAPAEAHAEVILAALGAGAHVLTEKPMAIHVEDAKRIVQAADRTGLCVAVDQNYRYMPGARKVRELLSERRHGELASFALEFFRGPRLEGKYYRHIPYPLVMEVSIHHYDLMRALTGREPVWTFAHAFNPPWSWFAGAACHHQVVALEGDVTGGYSASLCTLGAETPWYGRWRFECSEGVVVWDERGVRAGSDPNSLEEVPLTGDDPDGMQTVLAGLVRAVAAGRQPETGPHDNAKTLDMVFKTIESAETASVVRF